MIPVPMTRTLAPLLLATLTLASTPAQAIDPGATRYLDDASELFWFLQITDTHVGANLGYGTQDTDNLAWVLTAADEVIRPEFIVNTGDLVDATNGYLVPTAQYQDEWDEYNEVLAEQTVTFFHDLPGNHDTYFDEGATYYIGNALIGTAYGVWHEAWSHAFDYGEYVFVGMNSADTTGSWAGFDTPELTDDELAFVSESLDAYSDASLAFVFSHHPQWDLEGGGDEAAAILAEHGVSVWASGHVHAHSAQQRDGTLHQVLDSAGKGSEHNLGLFAVDGNGVSTRAYDIDNWPYVLITAPVDGALGGENPHAYPVSRNHEENPVRALIFDPEEPLSVSFSVDGGEAQSMERIGPAVWQGAWDATLYEEGLHEISVVAVTSSGSDAHFVEVTTAVTACDDGVDNDGNGYVDHDEDGGCDGPSDDDESGWTPPEDTAYADTAPPDSDPPQDSDPPGESDPPLDSGETGDSDGPTEPGLETTDGCGCTTGGALPSLGLVALLIGTVVRRRYASGR